MRTDLLNEGPDDVEKSKAASLGNVALVKILADGSSRWRTVIWTYLWGLWE